MTKRRSAGDGAVSQRRPGLYEARLDLGWQDVAGKDGNLVRKRVRRSYYGKTKQEALAKLRDAQKQAADGVLPTGKKQTVGQFLQSWLEEAAKPGVKPSTYVRYAEIVRIHLIPGLGNEQLDKLSVLQVQRFQNARLEAGLAPRTVHHMRAVLRTALNYAIKARLITFNPAQHVAPPKVPAFEPVCFQPQEAQAFLGVAGQDRLGALFMVAVMGVRQGEALGLRWEDVDLDKGTVTIRHTLRRVGMPGEKSTLVLAETKTAGSRRVLPMPPFVVEALTYHRQRQRFEEQAAGERWKPSGQVFTNPVGQPLEAKAVEYAFAALLTRAGLPPHQVPRPAPLLHHDAAGRGRPAAHGHAVRRAHAARHHDAAVRAGQPADVGRRGRRDAAALGERDLGGEALIPVAGLVHRNQTRYPGSSRLSGHVYGRGQRPGTPPGAYQRLVGRT